MRLLPLLTVCALALALLAAAPAAEAARAHTAGCITELPVHHRFGSAYSATYKRSLMHVRLRSHGPRIRNVKAELYTFGGDLIAQSKIDKKGFRYTKLLKMKLRFGGMQAGKYTLVVTGEPNRSRSCGPKKYIQVVEFGNCPEHLPIDFPNPPGGNAADYEDFLTISLRPKLGVMKGVLVEVYSFGGALFARGSLKALFGTAQLNLKLRHKLENGGYTIVVSAAGALPKACGEKTAQKVLTFGSSGQTPTSPPAGGDEGGHETEQPTEDEELPPDEEVLDEAGDLPA